MKATTIDSKLLDAKVAIQNALENEEVLDKLDDFGYNRIKLEAGLALLEKADSLHRKQQTEYGEKLAATTEVENLLVRANGEYMRYVKVARVALKRNIRGWEVMDIGARRKRSRAGWLEQALNFYKKALENDDILADLGSFGITKDKLELGLSLVEDYETVLRRQETEKGEAQAATKIRDEAFDALEDWFSDFIAIARIAFDGQPQYIEILGIMEPS